MRFPMQTIRYGFWMLRPTVITPIVAVLIFFAGIVVTQGDRRWYGDPVSFGICLALAANPLYSVGIFCTYGTECAPSRETILAYAILFALVTPVSLKAMAWLSLTDSEEGAAEREETTAAELPITFSGAIRETLRHPVYRCLYLVHSGLLLSAGLLLPASTSILDSLCSVLAMLASVAFQDSMLDFAFGWIHEFRERKQADPILSAVFIVEVVIGLIAMYLIERKALYIQARWSMPSDQSAPKEAFELDMV